MIKFRIISWFKIYKSGLTHASEEILKTTECSEDLGKISIDSTERKIDQYFHYIDGKSPVKGCSIFPALSLVPVMQPSNLRQPHASRL